MKKTACRLLDERRRFRFLRVRANAIDHELVKCVGERTRERKRRGACRAAGGDGARIFGHQEAEAAREAMIKFGSSKARLE